MLIGDVVVSSVNVYFRISHSYQVRMGGLYLMYAFYFCQPLDPPQKVRLTQSQWVAGEFQEQIVRCSTSYKDFRNVITKICDVLF